VSPCFKCQAPSISRRRPSIHSILHSCFSKADQIAFDECPNQGAAIVIS